jgi:NADH:ubiquinone reductase (H+-translocating)
VNVIIIGSGFGGIRAAKRLAKARLPEGVSLDVTIIDANNFHTFQPLLYQVATAGLDADDIGFPIRRIFRRNPSVHFVLGEVTAIDVEARTVTVDDGRSFGYDALIIAAGSVSTAFGVDGVNQNAFPLKTLRDSLELRDHLLQSFERASAEAKAPHELGIVVVGGGPTGVETAGALRELIDKVFSRDFPNLADVAVPITLVEATDRLLGTFHKSSSEEAAATLRRRHITVELGTGVDHVEPGTVVLKDGRRLAAGTIIWAAGVTASPLAKLLGVPLGRGGRIPVGKDLSVVGHPEIFAIGDIALTPDPLPQVAQPAIQGGRYAADTIVARLSGRTLPPFKYRDKGSMATIGRNQAVAELPFHLRFHGFIGWLMWLGLHLIELMGFRNRANVFVNWAWNYVTYDRGSRLLLEK